MKKTAKKTKVYRNRFPKGWNQKRVQSLINHYENQTEDEAVAEDELSSGNVFADLGVAHPEEALAKAQLARAICLLVEKEGLTQRAVAERLGIDQPKVSALTRGRLADFFTDRLLRFLLRLGHDVKISVQSKKATTAHANLRVAIMWSSRRQEYNSGDD